MKQAILDFSNKTIPAGRLSNTLKFGVQPILPEKYFKPNTDNGIVFKYLLDGLWHNGIEISQDLKPKAINWAYRTRISNIKLTCEKYHLSYEIESRKSAVNKCSDYRMVRV